MRHTAFVGACLLVVALLGWGCSSSGGGGGTTADSGGSGNDAVASGNDTGGPGSADPGAGPDLSDGAGAPLDGSTPGEEAKVFLMKLQKAKTSFEAMSVADFQVQYAPPAELKTGIDYDPMASTYMATVAESLELDPAEKAKISETGFVVSGRLRYPSYGNAYLDIYHKDLPVLLTADSVLFALHRSFDTILMALEQGLITSRLSSMLQKMHEAWGASALDDEDAQAAHRDVDVYLAVARSLLAGSPVDTADPADMAERDRLLGLVADEAFVESTIFGRLRKMDFSQMKPRGHYTQTEQLKRYFRAMMWLGRIDLRPVDQAQDGGSQKLELVRRQFLAAVLMDALLDRGDARGIWVEIDDLIGALIGRRDSLGPPGMHAFMKAQGLSSLAEAAKADPKALMAALLAGGWGAQRIRSHWIETDPFATETAALPISYLLLGQRFTVDSHVFSSVVYDSILYKGQKVERVLPMPLDVAFALGNNAVTPLLADEMKRYPYHQSLALMRWYIDGYDDAFWSESLYNTWLSALRGMNPSSQALGSLPETLRTEAWQRKLIHTQLTSWAQLRHDTLLYVKQSYTGGVACTYPAGYVEPYPEVYARIGAFAQAFADRLGTLEDAMSVDAMRRHLQRTAEIMGQLQVLAQKEVDAQPFTPQEEEFMGQLIDSNPGCGEPVYSGWYTELFFQSDDVAKEDLIIADVHTNPNTGPLPGPDVLHVATGDVFALVLSLDTCDGPMAFVGPVQSYHEVDVPAIKRLTDEEWAALYREKDPAPPWFEAPFWVHPPAGSAP